MASLLSANDDLLQNLPQSTPPVMKSDAGIAKMLAWCEERVLAINEALVLDASKPAGIDDTKPLHARQTELASLVQVCRRLKFVSIREVIDIVSTGNDAH